MLLIFYRNVPSSCTNSFFPGKPFQNSLGFSLRIVSNPFSIEFSMFSLLVVCIVEIFF